MKRHHFIILIIIIFSIRSILFGDWLNGYKYRREVVIESSYLSGTGIRTNFPVLFSSESNFLKTKANGGQIENNNGYDIVFTGSNGNNLIDFEIDEYNASLGNLCAWIAIEELNTTNDNIFYIYYGNTNISTSQETGSNVWDTNYRVVMHLNEHGTALVISDSSRFGNNGTPQNFTGSEQTNGVIGHALNFITPGTNDRINIPDSTSLDAGDKDMLTLSAWIYPIGTPTASRGTIITKNSSYYLQYYTGNKGASIYTYPDSGGSSYFNSTIQTPMSNWSYVVISENQSGHRKIYINGELACEADYEASIRKTSGSIGIGDQGSARHFNGIIDEVHISDMVRSADWIRTEFNNQNNPNDFCKISIEQKPGKLNAVVSENSPSNHFFLTNEKDKVSSVVKVSYEDGYDYFIITNLEVKTIGSLNDTKITNLSIYNDINNNGLFDSGESIIDSSKFIEDNGKIVFNSLSVDVNNIVYLGFLCSLTCEANDDDKNFNLSISRLQGYGSDTALFSEITNINLSTNRIAASPLVSISPSDYALSNKQIPINISSFIGGFRISEYSGYEAFVLTNIGFKVSGSFDDSKITNISIYKDVNKNGIYEYGTDTFLGSGKFLIDDYKSEISGVDISISNVSEDYLICCGIYGFTNDNNKTFQISVEKFLGFGSETQMPIKITNCFDFGTNTVIEKKNITAYKGANSPPKFIIYTNQLPSSVAQFYIASYDKLVITNISISAYGSFDDTKITNISIYSDTDGNGMYSQNIDTLIATGKFSFDNGTLRFNSLNSVISNSTSKYILAVKLYGFYPADSMTTLSFSISDILGYYASDNAVAGISSAIYFSTNTVCISNLDTIPPQPAGEVKAVPIEDNTAIQISWERSSDDGKGANDVVGYYLLRKSDDTVFTNIALVNSTIYTDRLLSSEKKYTYAVQSTDGKNLSEISISETVSLIIIPDEIEVYNNYLDLDNNESLKIVFGKSDTAEIKIYNIAGSLVKEYDKTSYDALDTVLWDGTYMNTDESVGAGIYFVIVIGNKYQKKEKIIIVK